MVTSHLISTLWPLKPHIFWKLMTPTNQWRHHNDKDKDKGKWLKDPTCAIFLKRIWLKDVKYEPVMHMKGDAPQLMHRFWCRICIVYSGLGCIFSLYLYFVPPFYVILGLQIYYLYIHKNMHLYVYKICICASTSLCICMTTKTLFQNRSLVFTYPSWPPQLSQCVLQLLLMI